MTPPRTAPVSSKSCSRITYSASEILAEGEKSRAESSSAAASKPDAPPLLHDILEEESQQYHGNQEFTCFPELPYDLRREIWDMSLRQPRVVSLTILPKARRPWQQNFPSLMPRFTFPSGNYPFQTFFQPPSISTSHVPEVSGIAEDPDTSKDTTRPYKLLVCDNIRRPPLLRVNRESRSAALSFYRVQFPPHWTLSSKSGEHEAMYPIPVCQPRRIDRKCAPCPLYLNPEHDYLKVNFPEFRSEGGSLCDFMRDLKNSDPRGKGLLNLIVGSGGTRYRPDSFDAVAWGVCPEVAKEVIGNLRELWFMMVTDRSMNRSFPISARAGSFTLLRTDPRHIDPYLQRMAIPCQDLSKTYKSPWQQLENSLGIVRSEPLQIRYALQGLSEASTEYLNRQIMDRVQLREFAAVSQNKSNYSFGRGRCGHAARCEVPDDENIPLVAGLWLFPESIVVPVLDAGPSGAMLVDLSAHRPQLCVYDLP